MNDEFLHRLRQPPPAVFAARLRARLESQVMARRWRRRQLTLYSLLACLLGGTTLALVVPSAREATRATLREVLPQPLRTAFEARAAQPLPVTTPRMEREAREQLLSSMQQVAPAGLPTATVPATAVAPVAPAARRDTTSRGANSNYVAGGGLASGTARKSPAIRIGGVAPTAAALEGAITEFERSRSNIVVNTTELSNERAFVKLCTGEIDAALTTRLIAPPELETCRLLGVDIGAVPIAYEALVVLANSTNNWLEAISPADLKSLFTPKPQPSFVVWSELNTRWPAIAVEAFAAANDLVFNVKPEQSGRAAALTVEAQSLLLHRLQRTIGGLTYVPLPRYWQLRSTLDPALKVVKVINDAGTAVDPTPSTIADGSYPLARPLLVFFKRRAPGEWRVAEIIRVALQTAERRLQNSAYVPLGPVDSDLAIRLAMRTRLPPFEPGAIKPITAREILLRQLPENEREQQRSKLPSN